mmetsp:Transcript_29943/g.69632  ORF Transcript_29943/g.69632 Transcript_29943/m.69632 type:complete len:213 (-) Transcript_29943:1217-1855(-)
MPLRLVLPTLIRRSAETRVTVSTPCNSVLLLGTRTMGIPFVSMSLAFRATMPRLCVLPVLSWFGVTMVPSVESPVGTHSYLTVISPETLRATSSMFGCIASVFVLLTLRSLGSSSWSITSPMKRNGADLGLVSPPEELWSSHTSTSIILHIWSGSSLCSAVVTKNISCRIISCSRCFSSAKSDQTLLKVPPMTPTGKASITRLKTMVSVVTM